MKLLCSQLDDWAQVISHLTVVPWWLVTRAGLSALTFCTNACDYLLRWQFSSFYSVCSLISRQLCQVRCVVKLIEITVNIGQVNAMVFSLTYIHTSSPCKDFELHCLFYIVYPTVIVFVAVRMNNDSYEWWVCCRLKVWAKKHELTWVKNLL